MTNKIQEIEARLDAVEGVLGTDRGSTTLTVRETKTYANGRKKHQGRRTCTLCGKKFRSVGMHLAQSACGGNTANYHGKKSVRSAAVEV